MLIMMLVILYYVNNDASDIIYVNNDASDILC